MATRTTWSIIKQDPLVRERVFPSRRDPRLGILARIERLPVRTLEGMARYLVTVGKRNVKISGLDFAKIGAFRLVGEAFRIQAARYNGSTCTNPWLAFCECSECRRRTP